MMDWGDCRIEVIARQDEILALAEEGYPASAIHRKLKLVSSLRSLQRWLRHLKEGKPVVSCAPPPVLRHHQKPSSALSQLRPMGAPTQQDKATVFQMRRFRPEDI